MAEFGHNFGMTANWPVQVEFVELMKNLYSLVILHQTFLPW